MSAKSLLKIQQDTCYVSSHLQAAGDVSEVPAGDTTGAGEAAGEGETETRGEPADICQGTAMADVLCAKIVFPYF